MPTLNPTTTFSSSHGDARDGRLDGELFCHHDPLEFHLRGHSLNPLVDVAMPLFGLVIRLRRTEVYAPVEQLQSHLTNQIKVMLEELRQHDYSEAELRVFSYVLCVFVDEAVLATPWGSGSIWQAKSLLSTFHQETWGGETFFTLLIRLQETPAAIPRRVAAHVLVPVPGLQRPVQRADPGRPGLAAGDQPFAGGDRRAARAGSCSSDSPTGQRCATPLPDEPTMAVVDTVGGGHGAVRGGLCVFCRAPEQHDRASDAIIGDHLSALTCVHRFAIARHTPAS